MSYRQVMTNWISQVPRTALLVFVIALLMLGFSNCAPVTENRGAAPNPTAPVDADVTATISIDSALVGSVPAKFSGFNAPQLNNSASYLDPNFINITKELSPGWIRFPAGVAGMAHNWSTGLFESTWVTQLNTDFNDASLNTMVGAASKLTKAKGGVNLADFDYFVGELGSGVDAIVSFNTFTDTNANTTRNMYNSATALGLNVALWELGNEPFAFNKWGTVTAFANTMSVYNTSLKTGSATAKSSLMFAGLHSGFPGDFTAFDNALAAHPTRFWDAASSHIYPVGLGSTLDSTARMKRLNSILLEGSNTYFDSYFLPKIGSHDLYLTEVNSSPDANPFLETLFNGIFLGEYIVRLSTHSRVKRIGVHALYLGNTSTSGIVRAAQDNDGYFINTVFPTGGSVDPRTRFFGFYLSAPGEVLKLVNRTVNTATTWYRTSISGGPTVEATGGVQSQVPALYAQAYTNGAGKRRVLIFNKSAAPQVVKITWDGAAISGSIKQSIASADNPFAVNTSAAKAVVGVGPTALTSNAAIPIRAYSTTLLEWD